MLEKIHISSNQFFLKHTLKKNTQTLREMFTNMYFPVFSQFTMRDLKFCDRGSYLNYSNWHKLN